MRSLAVALMLGLVGASTPWTGRAQSPPQPAAEIVSVRLSNFAFTPRQVHLRLGVPVRLHLMNDSSGGHSFSAPEFFAASTFPSGAPPRDGKIEVGAGGSADLVLVPGVAGTFKVECTHFLHGLFGMTGSIMVSGP
jgi:uncharacterized cupredoxin-like copper-binding protein